MVCFIPRKGRLIVLWMLLGVAMRKILGMFQGDGFVWWMLLGGIAKTKVSFGHIIGNTAHNDGKGVLSVPMVR